MDFMLFGIAVGANCSIVGWNYLLIGKSRPTQANITGILIIY